MDMGSDPLVFMNIEGYAYKTSIISIERLRSGCKILDHWEARAGQRTAHKPSNFPRTIKLFTDYAVNHLFNNNNNNTIISILEVANPQFAP